MSRRGRPPYPDVLTPREWEVLSLIRERLTNDEIASRLDVSFATAKFHVAEIISKLGVSDRREAAAWQPGRAAADRRWRLAALAPPLCGKRLPFTWLAKAAAGAVLTAAAAGIALLAWGVMSTSSDAVTTTGCDAEQSVGSAPNCAPGVAQTGAGADAITAISAGGSHTCALRDGGVWCWGDNWAGQLGNGSVCAPNLGPCGVAVPVAVPGLRTGVSAISAEPVNTCVVKDGGAWCWGGGGKDTCLSTGPPGEPEFCVDTAPAAVYGLASGVSDISGSCALKEGGVWCWGGGGGDPSTRAAGAMPGGLARGVSAISAGEGVSCALKDGGVWCWGSNSSGQLGNNSTTDSDLPVPVSGLGSGVSAISSGAGVSCALKDGGAWCWGWNADGRLGNNSTADSPVPVAVSGLASGVSAISTGGDHNCALKDDGIWCWGGNHAGQLGNNSTTDSPVPVPVSGLASGVSAVTVGQDHSCAVKDDGIWCWGGDDVGQLGNNSTGRATADGGWTRDSPVPVAVLFTPPSASDIADTTGGKPLASQPSADSADRRATYVLGGTAAAALAIAAAGVWAVRRRRIG